MHAMTRFNDTTAVERRQPLAQVEVLLLFHPELQRGMSRRACAETCARTSQAWLTLDVHGSRGASGITGRPVMEDMRLELHSQDIEALLPDGIVNDIADYLLGEA